MPALGAEFRQRASSALALAEIGEVARYEAPRGSRTRLGLHPARLESLYEMAFLRVFVGWEAHLEQAFLRYLCGYTSSHGAAQLAPGRAYEPSLAAAERTVLGTSSYVLWHSPARVAARSQRYFASSPVEAVVLSNAARLEAFAAVRHRIAHAQTDARTKFDAATMSLAGRRYAGSRPGSFLRDWDRSTAPHQRWLERLANELTALAAQVA